MDNSALWRHYFFDLPLFSLGLRHKKLLNADFVSGERSSAAQGVEYLQKQLGGTFSSLPIETIVRLAHLVRLVRESDTFALIRMNQRNMSKFFMIEGLEHIDRAHHCGKPVALIGGHLGSNYTMWVALGFLGYVVYTIARAVDHSSATPRARQFYMHFTYWLTSRKWPGEYLMSDSSGHFPKGFLFKELNHIFKKNGICFLAIDFPATLYSGNMEEVLFLGKRSRLPANFIRWAVKQNIELLTVQDLVEFQMKKVGRGILRRIRIGPPLRGANENEMLQDYANRLSELICREPWQWMGLQIAHQYHG